MSVKKTVTVYQTRYVQRPLFKQLQHSLQKRDWAGSQCRHVLVIHGNGPAPELDWVRPEHTEVIDWRGKTNGSINELTAALLHQEYQKINRHEFVAFLDDDGDFVHPRDSFDLLLYSMHEPDIAASGPMSWFLASRQFGAKCRELTGEFIQITKAPWATFGCQVYRTDHLQKSICLKTLREMLHRSDVYIFMQAHAAGFRVGHTPMNFNHICSLGYRTKDLSRSEADKERAIRFILIAYYKLWLLFGQDEALTKNLRNMRRSELKRQGYTAEECKALPWPPEKPEGM